MLFKIFKVLIYRFDKNLRTIF